MLFPKKHKTKIYHGESYLITKEFKNNLKGLFKITSVVTKKN